MPYWTSSIESRKPSDEGRCRISLDEHPIGHFFSENGIHRGNSVLRERCERLFRLHEIEVIVRNYFENVEHLVQHLPVLCCGNGHRVEIFYFFLELDNNRSELYGIRTCAEDNSYFFQTRLQRNNSKKKSFIRTQNMNNSALLLLKILKKSPKTFVF